ncbi:MAG: DNA polymerase Y family protein [Pseudomonadota bacterium]
MKRYLSIWFPHWPMERLARAEAGAVPTDKPLALVHSGPRGIRIVAVNAIARDNGLHASQPLADARAMLPTLQSRTWEPAADLAALHALARWCGRYGPTRNIEGHDDLEWCDGIWVDISGVAHLYGGEAGLLHDLRQRLTGLGLSVRAGIADTHGAAFALARGCTSDPVLNLRKSPALKDLTIAAPGATKTALNDLPVATLRLSQQATLLLRRLGLLRVGQLYGLPRAGLTKRFRQQASRSATSRSSRASRQSNKAAKSATSASVKPDGLSRHDMARMAADDVLRRLDEALGQRAEPLQALLDPPILRVSKAWTDPLLTAEGVIAQSSSLTQEIAERLTAESLGARDVCLSVYRSDGSMAEISAGMSAPCRDADHILHLLSERLATIDAGFGVDALALDVRAAEIMTGSQTGLTAGLGGPAGQASNTQGVAKLVDKLVNRLGSDSVIQLAPAQSHLPERAQKHVAFDPDVCSGAPRQPTLNQDRGATPSRSNASTAWPLPRHIQLSRPPILLQQPEPIQVLAQVPDGPPRRFTWRRIVHDVAESSGPERIAPEWWQALEDASSVSVRTSSKVTEIMSRTRDYYRVRMAGGHAFWIFRAGLFATSEGAEVTIACINSESESSASEVAEVSHAHPISAPRNTVHSITTAQDESAGHTISAGILDSQPRWFVHGLFG